MLALRKNFPSYNLQTDIWRHNIFRMIYFICIIVIKFIFQLRKKTAQNSFILALKICTTHFLKLYHVSVHAGVEIKLYF